MIVKGVHKCQVCDEEIDSGEYEQFSQNQEAHPGVLGDIHQSCYVKIQDHEQGGDPALPWTDPISGEVDYETMAQDLGVDDGSEHFGEDDYYYCQK